MLKVLKQEGSCWGYMVRPQSFQWKWWTVTNLHRQESLASSLKLCDCLCVPVEGGAVMLPSAPPPPRPHIQTQHWQLQYRWISLHSIFFLFIYFDDHLQPSTIVHIKTCAIVNECAGYSNKQSRCLTFGLIVLIYLLGNILIDDLHYKL